MKQNYKYTAADFERYHSGRMSEAEMHAIEKAALQDAFLAEALEGYSYADTPEKDIDDLKEKLLQKKKKKSVFLVIQKQNVWLRIAAIFILIIGGGYLAYQLNFSNENNTLAKKEEKQDVQNDTKQIAIPPRDSINTEKEIVVTPFVTNETVINKANEKIVKDNKILRETATENTSDDMPKESVQATPNPEDKRGYYMKQEKIL